MCDQEIKSSWTKYTGTYCGTVKYDRTPFRLPHLLQRSAASCLEDVDAKSPPRDSICPAKKIITLGF
jgi:hypothetical protein